MHTLNQGGPVLKPDALTRGLTWLVLAYRSLVELLQLLLVLIPDSDASFFCCTGEGGITLGWVIVSSGVFSG